MTHLNKRVQNENQTPVTSGRNDISEFKLVDLDTLRRRQAIFDQVKEQ